MIPEILFLKKNTDFEITNNSNEKECFQKICQAQTDPIQEKKKKKIEKGGGGNHLEKNPKGPGGS